MDSEEEFARGRIGRLARQLLRQERGALLQERTGATEQARSILASARRVHLDGIAAHLERVEDEALRVRCGELLALYDALALTPEVLHEVHAALVDLATALPACSSIARLRVAVRAG